MIFITVLIEHVFVDMHVHPHLVHVLLAKFLYCVQYNGIAAIVTYADSLAFCL